MPKDVLAERADGLFSIYKDLKAGRIQPNDVEHRVSDVLTLRQEPEKTDPERMKKIKKAIGSALRSLKNKIADPALNKTLNVFKLGRGIAKASSAKTKEISQSMYDAANEKMKDWRLKRLAYNLIEHLRNAKNNERLNKLNPDVNPLKKLNDSQKANLNALYDKYTNDLITEDEMPGYVVLIVAGKSPPFPTEGEDDEPLIDPTRGRYYYIWWLFDSMAQFKDIQKSHRFPCRRPEDAIDVEEIERKFIGSATANSFADGEYIGSFLYGRGQVPFRKKFVSPVPLKSVPADLLDKIRQKEVVIGLGVALDTSSEFKQTLFRRTKRVSSKGKGELNYDPERISYWKWKEWNGGVGASDSGSIKGRVVDKARATAANLDAHGSTGAEINAPTTPDNIGVEGIAVYIGQAGGNPTGSVQTGADGRFAFNNIPFGNNYRIVCQDPVSKEPIFHDAPPPNDDFCRGGDETHPNENHPGLSAPINITPEHPHEENVTMGVGQAGTARKLVGRVYMTEPIEIHDITSANTHLRNPNEPVGVDEVNVLVRKKSEPLKIIAETTTITKEIDSVNVNGYFEFDDLPAGAELYVYAKHRIKENGIEYAYDGKNDSLGGYPHVPILLSNPEHEVAFVHLKKKSGEPKFLIKLVHHDSGHNLPLKPPFDSLESPKQVELMSPHHGDEVSFFCKKIGGTPDKGNFFFNVFLLHVQTKEIIVYNPRKCQKNTFKIDGESKELNFTNSNRLGEIMDHSYSWKNKKDSCVISPIFKVPIKKDKDYKGHCVLCVVVKKDKTPIDIDMLINNQYTSDGPVYDYNFIELDVLDTNPPVETTSQDEKTEQ